MSAAESVRGAGSQRRRRTEAARRTKRLSLGTAPLLALVAAGGLLMVAFGDNAARLGHGQAQPLFWGGLIAIYMPIALRLLSLSASREERLALVLLLGTALYVVKVIYEPTGFTLHDELATWRQTADLMASGHPFSANPLVPGYAGFPGLEMFTAALGQVAGLPIFASALIVIGLARVVLMLALFVFLERAIGSARAAGIGMAIYACNPSFLYFDSQFGYESLAIVIAAALLLAALQWTRRSPAGRVGSRRGLIVAMAILIPTLTVTHHMTSYAMSAFLLMWAAVIAVGPGTSPERAAGGRGRAWRRSAWLEGPALPGLMLAVAALLWFAFEAGAVTTAELGGVLREAANSVVHFVFGGGSGSKALFQSAGQTNTTVARILGVASVVPLLAVIPLGLLRTWRGEPVDPLWRALAIVAFFYPLTLALRLTQAGTETSQRASEFVYVGLAFVSGLLIGQLPWRWAQPRRALISLGLAGLATVIFLGGFIVGESPVTRQPGPFIVSAESRSISPQGVAAAKFAALQLPPASRVIVDRPNSTLLASYGNLDWVSGAIEGIPVSRIFFSNSFDAIDRRLVIDDAIEYIVVDRRLRREVPVNGIYFEDAEPGAGEHEKPLSEASLRKFSYVHGLSRIFENGPIAIYSTGGLLSS